MDFSSKSNEIYAQLLEEIFTEIVFQAGIEHHFEESIQNELKKYIKEENMLVNRLDVFNNANSKDTNECICPNCGRTLGALRFAPHLEKCVGMGRSSSRIANRKILASSNAGKEVKYVDDSNESSNGATAHFQNNVEWVPPKSTRRVDSRKKRNRISAGKHGDKSKKKSVGGNNDDFNYAMMNAEAKQNFLTHMCGVVSEHTGRLCTRSTRCPKHSDEQRSDVRMAALNNNIIQTDLAKLNVQEVKSTVDVEMAEVDTDQNSCQPVKKSEQHRGKS